MSEIRESNPPHGLGKPCSYINNTLILNNLQKQATVYSQVTHNKSISLHFRKYISHTLCSCCKLHEVNFCCRHEICYIRFAIIVEIHYSGAIFDSSVRSTGIICPPSVVSTERHCHRPCCISIDCNLEISFCADDASIQE